MKKIIGITGGLATGKTTVADMFVQKGAVKIDADRIAHGLLEEDQKIRDKVIDAFGEGILTGGKIDRKKLANIVFKDEDKLKKLTNILHPRIIENIKERIEKEGDKIIVIDAPLLMEAGLEEMMDVIIVVKAERHTQIKRAVNRGISEEEAEAIIKNQMPLSEKIKKADYVIDNEEKIEKIKEGVERIWQNV